MKTMGLAPHVLHSSALTLTWTRKEAGQLRLRNKKPLLLWRQNIMCLMWWRPITDNMMWMFSAMWVSPAWHISNTSSYENPTPRPVSPMSQVYKFFTLLPFKLLKIVLFCHSFIFISLHANNHFSQVHWQRCNFLAVELILWSLLRPS